MAETFDPAGAKANASDTLKSFTEQALSAGRELKDKATDVAGTSADTLKSQAFDLVDSAKDVASQATEKVKEAVSEKKGAGADYVGKFANTLRRAAREFDPDLPLAGSYIRKAASQVDNVSDSIRAGEFNDVVRNAQVFARRQPTAFLGLAALSGFALVRFLKSSSAGAGASSAPVAREHEVGNLDDISK